MSDCTVCAHPQRDLIETDLCVSERPDWRALRQKYGLHHLALMGHKREHMKPAAYGPAISNGPMVLTNQETTRVGEAEKHRAFSVDAMRQVTEDPLSQFEQAWQLAHDDTKTQRRMMRLIVEDAVQDAGLKRYLYDMVRDALQSPDMGL